jgi:hypothetical protein
MKVLAKQMGEHLDRLLPRILTQMCRDPNSASFGCFDRDWWHYKIRDFPSVILQQGGYALWMAAKSGRVAAESARPWCEASCRFWAHRAANYRAFEEYYPWERGYPPLAFSTLAVAKMSHDGVISPTELEAGLRAASVQLLSRFEGEAANQQVGGLAALGWLRKIAPHFIPEDQWQALVLRTMELQTSEGWFAEYGGPDLGYLTVTLDCLWDLFDATEDPMFLRSIERAVAFIGAFFVPPLRGAGMHNSRNTDYLTPYGLARTAMSPTAAAPQAAFILLRSWETMGNPSHFVHATDDRYWSHYIGHSLARAVHALQAGLRGSTISCPAPQGEFQDRRFDLSGHVFVSGRMPSLVSARKGGIFTAFFEDKRFSDFGWVLLRAGDRRQWVTHWWADFWKTRVETGVVQVSGWATAHSEVLASPWKHMALRAASLLPGNKLIPALKKRLIFKPDAQRIPFTRLIRWAPAEIVVEDSFELPPSGWRLVRAPRASKRHVASADSYHDEDSSPTAGWSLEQRFERTERKLKAVTVYRPCSPV